MDNLVRGPRVFIAFDEENNERNINVGLISTVTGIRDSRVLLSVNGCLINATETRKFHGEFKEMTSLGSEDPSILNFAEVRFDFKKLYRTYGRSELSITIYIPGLLVHGGELGALVDYGPLIVHVPERWYEEMRSNEKEL